MLLSLVCLVRPRVSVTVPATLGREIHGAFLDLIAHIDRTVAGILHHPAPTKPFTTSPLHGPTPVREHRRCLEGGRDYWLRFTSIDAQLSKVLLALEQDPPPTLRLGGAELEIVKMTSERRQHPWAGRSSYESLIQNRYAPAHETPMRIGLQFVSLTTFWFAPTQAQSEERPQSPGESVKERRPRRVNILLPLPELVFSHLFEQWNIYATSPLPLALAEILPVYPTDTRTSAYPSISLPLSLGAGLDASVPITRYSLKSLISDFEDYRQIGFLGDCTYQVGAEVDAGVRRGLDILADFAFFAGVGYKTTMGMGQVRRERARQRS